VGAPGQGRLLAQADDQRDTLWLQGAALTQEIIACKSRAARPQTRDVPICLQEGPGQPVARFGQKRERKQEYTKTANPMAMVGNSELACLCFSEPASFYLL
jgi:hypothetical protein